VYCSRITDQSGHKILGFINLWNAVLFISIIWMRSVVSKVSMQWFTYSLFLWKFAFCWQKVSKCFLMNLEAVDIFITVTTSNCGSADFVCYLYDFLCKCCREIFWRDLAGFRPLLLRSPGDSEGTGDGCRGDSDCLGEHGGDQICPQEQHYHR